MLRSEPMMLAPLDLILSIIADGRQNVELKHGLYQIFHFGSSGMLPGYEDYPRGLPVESYGVCDSPDQLLAKCPEIEASGRMFVVTVTEVRRDAQDAEGGWRWCKWGPYIGDHEPQREYLADEPVIERVFCYHIYERLT